MVENIYIKSTIHISNLGEIVDPGSEKKTDAELELNTAEKLEEDDTESVGVTSEVGDSTKDVNGKEVNSPYSALVNVGSSFAYTVDRNKVDKNKNITEILASSLFVSVVLYCTGRKTGQTLDYFLWFIKNNYKI